MSLSAARYGRGQIWTPEGITRNEKLLYADRRSDNELDKQLRLSALSWMKLRDEELLPAFNLCRNLGYGLDARLVIHGEDSSIDIDIEARGTVTKLQITTAGPVWPGERHWGADYKCGVRLLNEHGTLSGFGRFSKTIEGMDIGENSGATGAELSSAYRAGIILALQNKGTRVGDDVHLLVQCKGYSDAMSRESFLHIAAEAFAACPLENFREIHIQAREPGYYLSLKVGPRAAVH